MKTEIFNSLTIIISGIALTISIWSIHLSKKKRKDDLYDKRYNFYKRICKYYISTYYTNEPPAQFEDLINFSEEASFLYGKDIKKHIMACKNKRNSNPEYVDEDFAKPFTKYLKL